MAILQFHPFLSQVEPAFWHALTQLKIDILRLSSDSVPLAAFYSTSKSILDKNSNQEINLASSLTLTGDAYKESFTPPPKSIAVNGILKNFNTIEEFKTADKAAIFNHLADQMWSTDDPASLNQFLLLTFADLKKYKYYYWFAFPAFVAKPAWEINNPGWQNADLVLSPETLASIHPNAAAFLIALPSSPSSKPEIASISSYPAFFEGVPQSLQMVAFVDPSADPDHPGWPLRNVLTYLARKAPPTTSPLSFQVLCWRDNDVPSPNRPWRSKIGTVHIPSTPASSDTRWTAVGWEKDLRGKMAPRMADLGSMMDPKRLADQATALNLKLMRWRILPSLNLESIAQTKCLLLGAGTLGCYVARTLMGWGVQKITLVDSAKVSFSNPVRQPLFDYEDCLNGGKDKAPCAAEKLKLIWPGIDAQGISLMIPMPGHPIPAGEPFQSRAREQVKTLEKLIDEHDVVYLLMDSRESRWLPTVLGASKGKIVINAALGFDSYLVMRHGPRELSTKGPGRLGCYYCNDIVAPADSLRDRTLDQMCTVTRPGLAPIAAATAVELMVSLIQHPEGLHAPAPPPEAGNSAQAGNETTGPGTSILGLVPHQLRGFLAQFRNMLISGAAYDRCTGCSETILKAYEEQGFDFLVQAFNDSKFLEEVTGLDKLYEEGEAALEQVDWEEGGEDEDF